MKICKNTKCKTKLPDEYIFCPVCGRKQTIESRAGKRTRGNGTGSVYQLQNKKWMAAVILGYVDGKPIKRTKQGFATKKDALEYLPILRSDNVQKRVKFYEAFEMWKEKHYEKIGKSKQSSYNTAYKRCTDLYFKYMDEIKVVDMQRIVDACPGAYYPKQDIKVLLNKVFDYAIINEFCKVNYAEHIELPPLEASKKDAFYPDEISRLFVAYMAGKVFAGFILIMIYTGMRYGEISTVLKENIFLDERYMIGGIKTEAGKNRVIAINDKIFPIVQLFYQFAEKKLVEMSEEKFYEQYWETIEYCGIRKLSPHCCRHTFSTLMAKAGIQPAVIKEMAGHANYSTTLKYTHIPLDTKLNAANSI